MKIKRGGKKRKVKSELKKKIHGSMRKHLKRRKQNKK